MRHTAPISIQTSRHQSPTESTHSPRLSSILLYLSTLCSCFRRSPKPLYAPLAHGDSIRLLCIKPGPPSAPIYCTLSLAYLDSSLPAYEALSYVWSLKEGTRTVTCNGQRQDVGTNLFEALQRLRLRKKNRWIWVDALCICQTNEREKANQVRMMHHIYASAQQVIVWLGTDDNGDAGEAFAVLCALVNAEREKEGEGKDKRRHVEYELLGGEEKTVQIEEVPKLNDKLWIKVMCLFLNAWFTRMWILQEIVLAQRATFIWGAASLDWSILSAAVGIVRKDPYLAALLECRNLQNAFLMKYLCEEQRKGERKHHPFLHLLDVARSFDVMEPMDKVYGLLGFPTRDASLETGVFMTPDYGKSLAEVYTEVARTLMVKERGLNVLNFVVHKECVSDREEKDTERLPSWVPNWSCKDIVYPFMGYLPHNQYHAGTGRAMEILQTADPRLLRLKGALVGDVAEVGERVSFTQLNDSTARLKELVRWCLRANVDTMTLAKTLTGGRHVSGRVIDDEAQHAADFIALLKALGFDESQVGSEKASALANRKGNPHRAAEAVWRYTSYRAPFLSEAGQLGLGPEGASPRDKAVVFWGGQTPFLVREVAEARYALVGAAYIEYVMDGMILELVENHELEERVFELV